VSIEVANNHAGELEALASRINAEHRACEEALKTGLRHALAAGELLLEAKGRIKHGDWGAWIRDNFEGSERTAQAYMKVARELPGLEGAKTQRVADLSFREALKELAAPGESKGKKVRGPEEIARDIRELMDFLGPELRDKERSAFEHRLANPGDEEEELLGAIRVEDLYLLAAQVAVDGFLFENKEDAPAISYRSADKTKVFYVPLPTAEEEHRERIRRGCEQYALTHFKVWRLLSNWLTKVVIAHCGDLDTIEERVRHNADWRQAEPAAGYLRAKLLRSETEAEWAAKSGMSRHEFKDLIAGVQVWINLEVLRWERAIIRRAA
jgi:hypothetical protein